MSVTTSEWEHSGAMQAEQCRTRLPSLTVPFRNQRGKTKKESSSLDHMRRTTHFLHSIGVQKNPNPGVSLRTQPSVDMSQPGLLL